ncbi:PfkB family carbohydrate kinase [Nocardioides ferulae]|uniref:PfkB family carbohydrate kinase n=1 Tax=Nocardioides ferulae TaxID=2340821 RepID=UPI000EAFA479|nr:PfkB family carbohydrate kinase [Nocardioides ferulae]
MDHDGRGTVLCFGLLTLDHLQVVTRWPGPNEKVVARSAELDFGGPAANAAATAAVLGSPARLVTAVGSGPLTELALGLVGAAGVEAVDLLAGEPGAPAVSSVIVTEPTGERAVISHNAAGVARTPPVDGVPLDGVGVLLLDGHHMAAATELARRARAAGVPVLLDGGSWKSGTEELLPLVDVALVSADFAHPDGGDVLHLLAAAGCPVAARSAGADPVELLVEGRRRQIAVPAVPDVVDTVGAGDVLHGALAHLVAGGGLSDPAAALARAAAVASESCRSAGAHGWFGRQHR